jgi:hypothetical protein
MAFEYSESYYGLRAFGSGGEVRDASATVTAVCTIADVPWAIAVGSGQITGTVTASASCSGEVVIIEDSSEFSYGSGLYGANQYGIENLQTIVSATSSIANVTGIRVRLATGIVAAESATVTIGGFTANAAATVTATSTVACSGLIVAIRSATVTSASTITANSTCTFNFTIPITVTSTTTCAAEEFFLEESDTMVYGHGLYGRQVFDQSDIQTVVSAVSSATATCNRVLATTTATVTAAAAISAQGRRVPEGSALINGTSTTVATSTGNGSLVRTSGATATPEATITTAGQIVGERSATVTAAASNTASAVTVVAAAATLTAEATIAAVCNRVRFGSGTPTAVASITVLGFATRGGIASCTPSASLVADSERIHQPSVTCLPEATITATCNRVQNASGIVSSTSGTATIGREKWEIISVTPITWTQETNDSVTWTQIAA